MKQKYSMAVIAVLIAGAGFYGGLKYGESKVTNTRNLAAAATSRGGNIQFRTNGTGGQRGFGGANGGFVSGDVISKDSTSITLKLQDGGSKIILVGSSTQVSKFSSGTLDDVQTGQGIVVTGSANSDGSITAQNIQLRPQPTQTSQ